MASRLGTADQGNMSYATLCKHVEICRVGRREGGGEKEMKENKESKKEMNERKGRNKKKKGRKKRNTG